MFCIMKEKGGGKKSDCIIAPEFGFERLERFFFNLETYVVIWAKEYTKVFCAQLDIKTAKWENPALGRR